MTNGLRSVGRASAGSSLAACGVFVLGIAAANSAQAQPIYHQGHADIGVAYEDGTFELHYHFEGTALAEDATPIADAEFAPSAAFTRVPDPSIPRSAGAQWNFTGTTAGGPIWFLPQTQDVSKPFLGWASEELDPNDWVGQISFSLTDVVSAPPGGEFSLWQVDLANNPTRLWDSLDGDFTNDFFNTVVGGHDHANFGFTAPGVYQIEITATGEHVADGLISGSGIFTFLVGNATQAPVAPSAVPEPAGLVSMAMAALVAVVGACWRRRGRRTTA